MAEKSGLISKTVLYLWLFALGTLASLSDWSCSSETSFFLLLRASALQMLARTLWCSGGSMLFTSSNLEEQQNKCYCPVPHHYVCCLQTWKTPLTQTFWWALWRHFSVWSWSVSSHRLECFRCPPSEHGVELALTDSTSTGSLHTWFINTVNSYHDSDVRC